MIRPLSLAHTLVSSYVKEGDTVIDATVGNGYDTEFLARLVGNSGCVLGFDIQEPALEKARMRLRNRNLDKQVKLYLLSHGLMQEVISSEVCAVMFNLGYLPGGDKSIITTPQESINALESATQLLSRGGIITIMAYPGHEGGRRESKEVEGYLISLPLSGWNVMKCFPLNGAEDSPFLLAAVRK